MVESPRPTWTTAAWVTRANGSWALSPTATTILATNPPTKRSAARAQRAIDLANWIEDNLWIVRKDRRRALIRFNPSQQIMLDFLVQQWAHEIPVRALVPKHRQGGVTTFWQAINFALAVLSDKAGRTYRCATVAHIEEASGTIFTMSRRFEQNLAPRWKRPLDMRQQGKLQWAGGSSIYVVSAQLGDSALKGDTIHSFHGTEVANWADRGINPSDLWTSAMPAVAPGPDSIVVLESTAKGRDPFFFAMCEDARKGLNPFTVLFLPWYLSSEYAMPWEEYCRPRRAQGRQVPAAFVATEDEEEIRTDIRELRTDATTRWANYPAEVSDDQLVWRRHAIETICENKPEAFRRYYPATVEECFQATNASFFSYQVLDRLYQSWRDPKVGLLAEGRGPGFTPIVTFNEWPSGNILVWKPPNAARSYVIGADVSEGIAEGDAQAAYVVDKDTLEVVAGFYGRVPVEDYVAELEKLGRFYGNALLAVESNFNPFVAVTLRSRGYPNLYWYKNPESPRSTSFKPGWHTNRVSRRLILANMGGMFSLDRVPVWCRGFAEEARDFVWNEKAQQFRAPPSKHDDRVIALAIALYLTGQRPTDQHARLDALSREADDLRAAARAAEVSPAMRAKAAEDALLQREARTRRLLGLGGSKPGGLYL